MGRAWTAYDRENALYIQNIKLEGVNRKGFATLYLERFQGVRRDRVILRY
jgi:hypothetical protein